MAETAKARQYETIQITEGMRDIPHKMKFRCVMMTPAAAAGLLSYNHPNNRKPKGSRIATYTSDIVNGLWQLTYEGVAIDEDGWLINGQNRLNAIIDAGKAAPILLITGVPRKAMLAVDQGISRSVADVARIAGETHKDMNTWVGVARAMMYGTKVPSSGVRASHQEVLAFIKAHENAISFAVDTLPNKAGISQAPVRATIARAFYLPKTKHTRLKEFCNVLTTGLMGHVELDKSAIKLRNWLTDNFSGGSRKRHSGMRAPSTVVYGKTQSALRAFLNNEPIETLRESNKEHFPLPEERETADA
jgi:hypothetical protein